MEHSFFVCSWSGGKDSCYALLKAKALGITPKVLLNVLNEAGNISRSHGIPKHILQAQAAAAGLPIHLLESSWQDYEQKFTAALTELRSEYNIDTAVFGDIDLQAHRDWEEKVCASAGLKAILPLWQQDRKALVFEMLEAGIQTMIVSCNELMGERFLGRVMDAALVHELEGIVVDVFGWNGAFHTLGRYCNLFKQPIQVAVLNKLKHEQYWFTELALVG